MAEPIQVSTTAASLEDAQRMGRALVERRLAACAQVSGPITSHYRWNNQLESSQEWICTLKTDRAHYDAIEEAIREMHSYELPEIIAVPILAGSRGYLAWLAAELAPSAEN